MPRVPGLGQLLQRERAVDELLLELEAQDDVERVGGLVGVDADQAWRGAVDRRARTVELDRRRAAREAALELGQDQRVQKARWRPTRFSQVRLCDSSRPSDGAARERRARRARGRSLVA